MATRQGRQKHHGGKEHPGPPDVVWTGKDYPLIESGLREVQVTAIQGPEWVRSFRRWSLRVECNTLDEPGEVSAFFNLGNDPAGPKVGRQSRIFKLWCLANNGPPRTGEKLDFRDLLLDKIFVVQIERSQLDRNGKPKPDGEIYSYVAEFLRRSGP